MFVIMLIPTSLHHLHVKQNAIVQTQSMKPAESDKHVTQGSKYQNRPSIFLILILNVSLLIFLLVPNLLFVFVLVLDFDFVSVCPLVLYEQQ